MTRPGHPSDASAPSSPWQQIGLTAAHPRRPGSRERLASPGEFAPLAEPWARAHGGPADHELLQLSAGRRSLIKRERGSEASALATQQRFEAMGFLTRLFRTPRGPGGSRERFVVFIAREPRWLEEGERCEQLMELARSQAVRGFGELLGYPRCCVEALAEQSQQDDDTQIERLARAQRGCCAWANNWVSVELRPFSHFPCAPDCRATATLAADTLELVEAEHPRYAAALRTALCSVAMVQSVDRFALLLGARVTDRGVAYESVLSHRGLGVSQHDAVLESPRFRAFYLELVEPLEQGDRVLTRDRTVRVFRGEADVACVEFAQAAPWLLDFTGSFDG